MGRWLIWNLSGSVRNVTPAANDHGLGNPKLTHAIARNLKFYPLTLYQAMKEGPLWFIADTFKVITCVGEEKLFRDLNVWELLNLRSQTILSLADALYAQFGITSKYLEGALDPYSIQTVGRGELERYFGITKPMKYFHAKTRHYSWPKGGGMSALCMRHFVRSQLTDPSYCGPRLWKHAWNQTRFGLSY